MSLPVILQRVKDEGHAVFTRGRYNLNIVGVRSPPGEVNTFDDELHLIYKDDRDEWVDLSFACTTDPGLYWLKRPMNVGGTAILKEGQYRGAYLIGKHRGIYKALVQRRPVKCYRDRNRDNVIDFDVPVTEGLYGINIHHAGVDSKQVDKWSAGCTVIGNLADWNIFMAVIERSAELYGERFTYTLIDRDCRHCGGCPCECKEQ